MTEFSYKNQNIIIGKKNSTKYAGDIRNVNTIQHKFNRDMHDKCVIHLIYCSPVLEKYEEETEECANYDENEEDANEEDVNEDNDRKYIDADTVDQYITDQIPDMWNDMRAGDLIEDINRSGYRSDGVYAVDIDESQCESLRIIKNGLRIVNLNAEYGTIPYNFYAITRFTLGYHNYDSLITNNRFVANIKSYSPYMTHKSYWHAEPCYTPFDKTELNFDNLTEDDIFYKIFNFECFVKCDSVSYLYYIIVTHKQCNYLIGSHEKSKEKFIHILKHKLYHHMVYGDDIFSLLAPYKTECCEDALQYQREIYDFLTEVHIELKNCIIITACKNA